MKFIKKNTSILVLILILSLITTFTHINSVYFSDLHHWGFIAGHSLDYINGGIPFKNVFVQYGIGQLVFFKLINYIYPINFSSIGTITAFIYCLNLIILYFILKKVSSEFIALFILTIIFFCKPYINYPWPDYLASFCLLSFSFFLIYFEKDKIFIYIFSGFFLFLSILFRTTYLLHIFLALIFYFISFKIDNKFYNKRLVNSLKVFVFCFSIYIFYLIFNNVFEDWLYQGILAFKDYVIPSDSIYMSWVIENLGLNFWILLKILKVLLRFAISFIIPQNINDFVFLVFFFISFLILISYFIKQNQIKVEFISEIRIKFRTNINYNIFFFFCLLGFFGVVQSIFYFVFYKNLNASILLFIPLAYLLNCTLHLNNQMRKYSKIFFITFFFISSINLFEVSKKFHNINTSLFFNSDIIYFGKRKFLRADLEYYYFLKKNICNKDLKIINFSLDTNLDYLCSNKRSFIFVWHRFLPSVDNDLFLRVTKGELNENEVLVTSWFYQNNNLKIYNRILLPYNLMWWGSASKSKFQYLYKKK